MFSVRELVSRALLTKRGELIFVPCTSKMVPVLGAGVLLTQAKRAGVRTASVLLVRCPPKKRDPAAKAQWVFSGRFFIARKRTIDCSWLLWRQRAHPCKVNREYSYEYAAERHPRSPLHRRLSATACANCDPNVSPCATSDREMHSGHFHSF